MTPNTAVLGIPPLFASPKIGGIRGVKTVEGNDESLYCHGNLIIPLIKRGMMSDYAHVNHASVSIHNHSSFPS